MADLSFGVNGPTIQLNVTMSISDTDAPRIMGYLASVYGLDAEGNARTPEQVAEAFAGGILQGLLDQTVRHEREAAMKAAAAAVSDIAPL
jgi:hypothetical protein